LPLRLPPCVNQTALCGPCTQDGTLTLWDVRKLGRPLSGGGVPAPLHAFAPLAAPVGGAALMGGSAVAWGAGADRALAVLRLAAPYGEQAAQVRLEAGAGGLGGGGGAAPLVGAAILPLSRLLLVGTADGFLRICC